MTETRKSYNMQALRGMETDDAEVAEVFREEGVNVPEELLYTPEFPKFLIEQTYELNRTQLIGETNPNTGLKYTDKEAEHSAREHRAAALKVLNDLM